MFVDKYDIAEALAQLPDEAWTDWTVDQIAEFVMVYVEDQS